jgi:TPP-dependent pyruvate/acetoin dehydrogenase alpha subunit
MDNTAATEQQREVYEREFLLGLYERMFLIRAFEQRIKLLFLEGVMPGTIHQCEGQEACAVGVCSSLLPGDFITSTHRPHGHALAKGLTPREMLDELFGRSTGCCRGKGGSMHLGNMQKGMVPAIAIVGGGIPLAAGMALAFKMRKTGQVVACFFGEGANNEGAFHEGVNLAAIWSLPVVFVCENNLYGASTRINLVMKPEHVARRAAAYGIRGQTVDGNDVLAVHEAARRAVEECRQGQGPVLLELLTYRRCGQSRRDPCHYQPQAERDAWFQRDPLELHKQAMLARGDISREAISQIEDRVRQCLEQAVAEARCGPEPPLADLLTDVLAG